MIYFVEYNAKFMAMYHSVKWALKFIKRKGYRDDANNMLRLFDKVGNEYDPITGKEIK